MSAIPNQLGATDFLKPYIHMVMGMIDREELRVEVREEDLIFIYPEHKSDEAVSCPWPGIDGDEK